MAAILEVLLARNENEHPRAKTAQMWHDWGRWMVMGILLSFIPVTIVVILWCRRRDKKFYADMKKRHEGATAWRRQMDAELETALTAPPTADDYACKRWKVDAFLDDKDRSLDRCERMLAETRELQQRIWPPPAELDGCESCEGDIGCGGTKTKRGEREPRAGGGSEQGLSWQEVEERISWHERETAELRRLTARYREFWLTRLHRGGEAGFTLADLKGIQARIEVMGISGHRISLQTCLNNM